MSLTPEDADGPIEDYRLGWLAINKLVAQGFSWSGHERNCAFLNTGGGPFADASSVTGLDFDDDGRSIARVDWDQDGDLDLFLTNRTGPRLRFLRNDLEAGHGFLRLKLQAQGRNRDAIGARVQVTLAGSSTSTLHRTRRAGDGYQAQSSAWLHFGLGTAEVAGVQVTWPDGTREDFPGTTVDGHFLLVQGAGMAKAWSSPGTALALTSSTMDPPRPRSASRVVLASPIPMPGIPVDAGDGRSGSLFGLKSRIGTDGPSQRPLLIQLWASWCAPCVQEMGEFTEAAETLQAAGIEILGLNIEEGEERRKAVTLQRQIGWPFPNAFATRETVEILDTLQGALLRQDIRMPLPSSFLVDGNGNLIAFYLGQVTPEQVLEDLALLPLGASDRLLASLPFPGRWNTEPKLRSPNFLERAFQERGLIATAREYQPGWIHLQFGRTLLRQRQFAGAETQFRAALEAGPYFAESFAGLGQALHLQDRAAEAVDAYRRSLQLDSANATTRFQLGLAYLVMQDFAAAQAEVDQLEALGSPLAAELLTRLDAVDKD